MDNISTLMYLCCTRYVLMCHFHQNLPKFWLISSCVFNHCRQEAEAQHGPCGDLGRGWETHHRCPMAEGKGPGAWFISLWGKELSQHDVPLPVYRHLVARNLQEVFFFLHPSVDFNFDLVVLRWFDGVVWIRGICQTAGIGKQSLVVC